MDLSSRLSISYYKVVAPVNEPHGVYLVRHQETGEFFVKKVLDVYSAEVYRELRAHPVPGIPRIIECCENDGQLTVIEEFISGTTLRALIDRTAAFCHAEAAAESPDRTASKDDPEDTSGTPDKSGILTAEKTGLYMIRLCEILERLHGHNPPLVHRDLKPSNIIITSFGNVALLDFNAAKYYSGEAGKVSDTRLLGTRGYAAPEQYGFGESSPKTDIYSLGKILRECVSSLPDVPENHIFDDVIAKCTQMEPSKRYGSAAELREALERSLGLPSSKSSRRKVVNPYFPPGFRTLDPPKMLIAAAVYLFVLHVCMTLKVNGSYGAELWFIRICVLALAFLNIAVGTNYLGVLRFFPFIPGPGRGSSVTRTAAILLAMVIVTLLFFALLVYIVGAFFS